jgi:predicted DNA-binding transcriptional regulator AlpA
MTKGERQRPDRQQQAASIQQRAMGVPEFCKRYGIGRTRFYQELKEGRLRARKCGRRTIVTEDDAEHWLQRLPALKTGPVS